MKKRAIRKIWTTVEMDYLREHYPHTLTQQLADHFGCALHQVYNKAHAMGLKKTSAFKSQNVKENQLKLIAEGRHKGYPKGHVPANAGKKMSDELREKVKHTFFPKGHRPHNWHPVGTQRTLKDGYQQIKIKEPRTWQFLHYHNWEKCFGKVPKDYILRFKNNDRSDCSIENLELITFQENMSRNTIQRYPEPVKQTIRLISKLKKQIKNHEQ